MPTLPMRSQSRTWPKARSVAFLENSIHKATHPPPPSHTRLEPIAHAHRSLQPVRSQDHCTLDHICPLNPPRARSVPAASSPLASQLKFCENAHLVAYHAVTKFLCSPPRRQRLHAGDAYCPRWPLRQRADDHRPHAHIDNSLEPKNAPRPHTRPRLHIACVALHELRSS